MSSLTPVRDDQSGNRETFRSLVTRSASRLPAKRRRDLTTVLILRRVATTRLPPWPGWNLSAVGLAARSTPSAPPHGIAATPKDRGTSRLRAPPPRPSMAMDDLRLALPCELYRLLSDALGFLRRHRSTVGAAHREKHNAKACARIGDERLIPAIHRAVATLGCAGRGKWRVPDRASFGDQYRYAKSSREGFPRVFSRRIGGS
jgi:hypothetical protein